MHRGTNPIIKILTNVDTSLITDIIVTFKQNETVVEKHKDDCTFEEGVISTQLTQEETLGFKTAYPVRIQAKVQLSDGTVAATEIEEKKVKEILNEDLFEVV